MKKVAFLIAFVSLFSLQGFSQIVPGSCGIYTITLEDSWIWGWEGGYIDIYVNGTLYAGGVTVLHSSGADSSFVAIDIGDTLSIDYTAGSNSSENQYTVYDEGGAFILTEGSGPVTPEDVGDYSIPSGLTACGVVGIRNDLAHIGLRISPNPSNGVFALTAKISGLNALEIRVMNIQGQVILTKSLLDNAAVVHEEIDLREHSKGIYFVMLTSDNGRAIRKVIVE